MAWCRQATGHYLSQCWPKSLLPYDATRPQIVNPWCVQHRVKFVGLSGCLDSIKAAKSGSDIPADLYLQIRITFYHSQTLLDGCPVICELSWWQFCRRACQVSERYGYYRAAVRLEICFWDTFQDIYLTHEATMRKNTVPNLYPALDLIAQSFVYATFRIYNPQLFSKEREIIVIPFIGIQGAVY